VLAQESFIELLINHFMDLTWFSEQRVLAPGEMTL
jgi:ABC-type cobalamin transport system permease subunit